MEKKEAEKGAVFGEAASSRNGISARNELKKLPLVLKQQKMWRKRIETAKRLKALRRRNDKEDVNGNREAVNGDVDENGLSLKPGALNEKGLVYTTPSQWVLHLCDSYKFCENRRFERARFPFVL